MKLTYDELQAEVHKQGPHLFFNESVVLNMTELPVGIQSITVVGIIRSKKLTTVPDGVIIKACDAIETYGNICFDGLTMIGNNVTFEADSDISFKMLTQIGNNISFDANRFIWLNSLTTIGNNIVIHSGWEINFQNLTAIGNNVSINSDKNILFAYVETGLKKIELKDDGAVSDEMKQFLLDKNITVRCSETSQLVNLAFEGIKVAIVK